MGLLVRVVIACVALIVGELAVSGLYFAMLGRGFDQTMVQWTNLAALVATCFLVVHLVHR